ncbi:hypothetical protein M3_0173 [Lysinibacillus phage vB_LfM_LysYB1]|nr:hypothetical protein M3_0173 [Lysinibacillus phage vB_LfM_LysYB1]WAB25316.1 hypothetical protein M5_0138 [Lysinibacillus phage vB_LfM_LysYB2]
MCQSDENKTFCVLCEKEYNKFEMSVFRSAPGSMAYDGWICMECSRNGKQEKATPQDGGCWYCHKRDGGLVFDIEFDTFVHKSCTAVALTKHPVGTETRIIARSIGLLEEEQHGNL